MDALKGLPVGRAIILLALLQFLLGGLAASLPGITPALAWQASAMYLAGALLTWALARAHLAGPAFGVANCVTLTRWMLTALLLAALGQEPGATLGWLCVVVSTVALILDGFDGALARRHGEASAFGARFDMETDAFLMLVLSVLVWHFDRAGAWIMLAGGLRYLFVAAAVILPCMRQALPESMRRKTACVIQLIALVVALGPIIPAPLALFVAGAGLLILSVSFLLDVLWLARAA